MIVGTPSTLTFSLVAPSGVTYSSPTVTVESNPWPTASALTDNGDGTYSITITPDREIQAIIKLKVVHGAQTFYHSLMTQASGPLSLLNPSPGANVVGNGSITFDFNLAGLDGVAKMWDLRQDEIIKAADIGLTANTAGVTIALLSRSNTGAFNRCRISAGQTWGSADQYKLTWKINVKHPLSKAMHQLQAVTDHFKAPIFTWVSAGPVTSGVPVVLEFTAKFASGNPVRELLLKPTTITGGTVDPDIIVIDEDAGRYGVRVTPGFVNFSINPQVSIGNSVTMNSVPRTFTSVAGATATMATMAGASRTIGIKLAGATAGDIITGISAGAVADAITGSWSPSNGVFFVPIPISQRGRPANTNTTPTFTDTVNVTFTRGGTTYTVPMSITGYWAHIQITGFTLTNNLLAFSAVASGATASWSFGQLTFLNEQGVSLGTSGSNAVNTIATDGRITWNMTAHLASQGNVSFLTSANNGAGSTYYAWSNPFEVIREPYFAVSPVGWNFSGAESGNSIPQQDLADLLLTFTDDLGVPLKGVTLDVAKLPTNFTTFFGPRMATPDDWSTVLVPQTTGNDGKYLLKIRCKGYPSNWWLPVYSTTIFFSSTDYPGGSKGIVVAPRIN